MSDSGPGTLYFHSPCFDGIVSAVIAADFLERRRGWPGIDVKAVNYEARSRWLKTALQRPAAIVDFLYHPAADFWADHHPTAFLTIEARQHFEARRSADCIYDERSPSCAGLLHNHLARAFDFRDSRLTELIAWADKIDAARYDSVEDAIRPRSPVLRLNASLISAPAEYCEGLVAELRKRHSLEVADLPAVRARADRIAASIDEGLQRFKAAAHLEDDDIVVFDVDVTGTVVSRYAPYLFFPHARYSVGIIRGTDWTKITAMRNPWREFPSAPLGQIAAGLGGGGHHRVGSLLLTPQRAKSAASLRAAFVDAIRKHHRVGGA